MQRETANKKNPRNVFFLTIWKRKKKMDEGKQLQSVTASQPISRQFQIKFKLLTCPISMTQIESESSDWEKRSQIRCGTQRIHTAGEQQSKAFYSLNWCDRKCQSTLINKPKSEWNVEANSVWHFRSCPHNLAETGRFKFIQMFSSTALSW